VQLTQTDLLCYQCARNYQSWWKFVEVMAKIILHSFLSHGVQHRANCVRKQPIYFSQYVR